VLEKPLPRRIPKHLEQGLLSGAPCAIVLGAPRALLGEGQLFQLLQPTVQGGEVTVGASGPAFTDNLALVSSCNGRQD